MTAYEEREWELFKDQMLQVEMLPLAERKANAVRWFQAISEDHMGVAQKVGWLLNGSYGKGAFDSACRVLASPRMNHVAWCAITIASVEYGCPAKFAIQAWKKLPVEKRYLVNEAIRQEIADAKREGYCGEIKKNPKKSKMTWEQRVRQLEEEGLDRSDAQGVVDVEIMEGWRPSDFKPWMLPPKLTK